MSKPEWCPADVWETAREALIVALRDERCGLAVIFGLAGEGLRVFQDPIARAILAERERAARVAEEYRSDNPFPTIHGAIARAILNPPAATQSDGGGE